MAHRTPVEVSGLPSIATIALASLLIKSRHNGEDIEESIKRFQQPISDGVPRKEKKLVQQFDSSLFWKQAYETSEAAQTKLLDRIYRLEQQLRTDSPITASATVITSRPGKRKRDEPDLAKANSRSKRQVIDAGREDGKSLNIDDFMAHWPDEQTASKEPTRLLRYLYNLRRLSASLQAQPSSVALAIGVLCRFNFSILLDAIDHDLRISIQNPALNKSASSSDWNRLVRLTIVSHFAMLEALRKLQHPQGADHNHTGAAIAEIVHFVQCILGQIHAVSIHKASGKEQEKSKGARTRSRKLPTENISGDESANAVCMQLTKILLALFRQLSMSCSSHAQLCEGIICAFLDHLGSSLSLVVFADPGQRSPAGQLGICPPTGLEDVDDLDTEVSTRAAAFEAPFLVAVLKQIMVYVEGNPENAGLMFGNVDSLCSNSAELRTRLRTRLQNTLLRGVFGDSDEAFRDALRRADSVDLAEIGDSPGTSDPEEMTLTSEWFIGQVWTHLGWQILSEHVNDQA